MSEDKPSNQCGAKGCKNSRDSGAFVGPFCAPCDHDLRTGNFEFGTSVVYEQAREIERAKRIMQRAISWLQIKEAAFTTRKGPAIIEEMRRYVGDLPDETSRDDARDAARYRFLRQPDNAIVYAKDRNAWGKNASGHVRYDTAEQLDAAVDAARGAEEQLCNCGEFCNKSLGQPHAGTCRRLKQGLPVNGDGKQNG